MQAKTRALLVAAGLLLGGVLAWRYYTHTGRPPTPEVLPAVPPETPTTPAQRQTRDRYRDEQFGFEVPAPRGWYNETGGELRKQFAGARGALVREGTQGRVSVMIEALALPPGSKPDVAGFLAAMRRSLSGGPGTQVTDVGVIQVAGAPTAALTTATRAPQGQHWTRHVWIFGPRAQVHLSCADSAGTFTATQKAFAEILRGFTWTSSPPASS